MLRGQRALLFITTRFNPSVDGHRGPEPPAARTPLRWREHAVCDVSRLMGEAPPPLPPPPAPDPGNPATEEELGGGGKRNECEITVKLPFTSQKTLRKCV